ncbi:hypothetical protein MSAN_01652800 [Mycena sanguinolenta]|uniref:DUF6699 domain-containing protein n=1 Tax=Mycena sanguinolenta TaxID=230812 RepID=A0A8H7CWM3_9AGAR|nr:hypothetical protein MSAN_01652800 [Mycena sanguinolenta]
MFFYALFILYTMHRLWGRPQSSLTGFVNPVRPPLFTPGLPTFDGAPIMPPIPPFGVDLTKPSALAWQAHVQAHFMFPPVTPATTITWPGHSPVPVEDGVVALPADTLHWTPGTFPAIPFGTPVPLHVHPTLIPNPINPTIPVLQWDILHSAEQARLYTGRGILKKPNLKEDAIYPSAPKIWIEADELNCPILVYWMRLWGPIVVEAGSVKIRDILDQVHDYFDVGLTRQDLELIKSARSAVNPAPYNPLRLAAGKRIADAYALPVYSKKGFKRIDVLGIYRCWGGVRPIVLQDGTWRLLLNLLPYAVPRVA